MFPESGTAAMVDLNTTTNDGMIGRYCFKVDTAGVVDTCAGLCVWSCFYPHLKRLIEKDKCMFLYSAISSP